tara:strand:- start:465 stop:647 length:183 start_codon:yes stop_codon:yes gene_type:complete
VNKGGQRSEQDSALKNVCTKPIEARLDREQPKKESKTAQEREQESPRRREHQPSEKDCEH